MPGSTALVTRNMLFTFTAMTRSHSSSLVSRKASAARMPAWFISTVIGPKAALDRCDRLRHLRRVRHVGRREDHLMPGIAQACATASPGLPGRSTMPTRAPSAAKRSVRPSRSRRRRR